MDEDTKKRLEMNAVTMSKMTNLKSQLQSLSMRKDKVRVLFIRRKAQHYWNGIVIAGKAKEEDWFRWFEQKKVSLKLKVPSPIGS